MTHRHFLYATGHIDQSIPGKGINKYVTSRREGLHMAILELILSQKVWSTYLAN